MSGFMISGEGGIIALVSVGISLASVIVRKLVLDQAKLKSQREEIKQLQQKIKDAQKSGDTKGMSELYTKIMDLNSQMMKQSFKPMIFTLIPFLLIFSWMRGTYDYTAMDVAVVNPMPEGISLSDVNLSDGGFYNKTASMLIWRQGMVQPGNYSTLTAEFIPEGGGSFMEPAVMYYKSAADSVQEPLKTNATDGMTFLKTVESNGGKTRIILFYNNTKSNIVANLGGFELGWFGWYFLCSIAASMVLNKIFKVS